MNIFLFFRIESAPCQFCFLRMPYESIAEDQENSWRKNRISNELKGYLLTLFMIEGKVLMGFYFQLLDLILQKESWHLP